MHEGTRNQIGELAAKIATARTCQGLSRFLRRCKPLLNANKLSDSYL